MYTQVSLATLLISGAAAFPWVPNVAGVDSSLLRLKPRQAYGTAATCPFNSNHTGAAPYNPKYPYCGAQNGAPGYQTCINNLVPAQGDTAHVCLRPFLAHY